MSRLILASASQRRKDLLYQIGIIPDEILSANIDESPLKKELPADYVLRIALEKAIKVQPNNTDSFVIAADTIVSIGRNILHKAMVDEDVRTYLRMLSGRSHVVRTAICITTPEGKRAKKIVITRVVFKRISEAEIDMYIKSGEGIGKAGGYAIQGLAACFVQNINGSYSSIVGLPLLETRNLLIGLGYKHEYKK